MNDITRTSNERDAFEAWAKHHHWSILRSPYNSDLYRNDHVQHGWLGWRAARAENEPRVTIGAKDYDELLGQLGNINAYEPDDAQEIIDRAVTAIRDLVSVASSPPPAADPWHAEQIQAMVKRVEECELSEDDGPLLVSMLRSVPTKRVQHAVTCKQFPDPHDEREPAGPCTCSDCPPVGYPTNKTRCAECPRLGEPE